MLLPNPDYGGHRPRHWARIVYTLDVPTPHAVALVDRGKLDYLPLDFDSRLAALAPRRARPALRARSPAAEHGGQRYFPTTGAFLDYIVLNASRPLFRDVRLRRAVNYALDRPTLAAAFHDAPGDQIVPPSVAGFPAGAVYPIDGPDLTTARRLAGDRRRHAVLYVLHVLPVRRRRPSRGRAAREVATSRGSGSTSRSCAPTSARARTTRARIAPTSCS